MKTSEITTTTTTTNENLAGKAIFERYKENENEGTGAIKAFFASLSQSERLQFAAYQSTNETVKISASFPFHKLDFYDITSEKCNFEVSISPKNEIEIIPFERIIEDKKTVSFRYVYKVQLSDEMFTHFLPLQKLDKPNHIKLNFFSPIKFNEDKAVNFKISPSLNECSLYLGNERTAKISGACEQNEFRPIKNLFRGGTVTAVIGKGETAQTIELEKSEIKSFSFFPLIKELKEITA